MQNKILALAAPDAVQNFKVHAVELFIATLVISILSLALPLLTLQIYDRILPTPNSGTFPVLIAGLIVAVCLEMVIRLGRAWMVSWNGACYEHRVACDAMDKMLNSELGRFHALGYGNHINGFHAIARLKEFACGASLITYYELLLLPVYIILMFYISGPLIFVPIFVLMVFTALAVYYGHNLKEVLHDRDVSDDQRYDFLIESLEGIHTLKALALEDRFMRRYEAMERNSTETSFKVSQVSSRIFNMTTVFNHIMLVAVISVGAILVLDGTITSGALIATVLLSGRLMQPVQRGVSLWVRYQDYVVATNKLESIMSLPQVQVGDSYVKPERYGDVNLNSIGFRHDVDGPYLFQNVNLEMALGNTVRITGGHGSGKTVLLNIIAGLYKPSEGQAFVDGVEPIDYPTSERIKHVALLRTSGVIFQGTVRDNITRFGAVPENEARDVSNLLGIDRDVATYARGFDTMLDGTDNDIIPPGLRQRIAIARALVSRPRVILFDNADRNLDREGYLQVYRLLSRLREKVTLVLVSDDRNISRLADRHYYLDNQGLHLIDGKSNHPSHGNLRA
jgi:ATP-binding cassette subfamily C protein LapB